MAASSLRLRRGYVAVTSRLRRGYVAVTSQCCTCPQDGGFLVEVTSRLRRDYVAVTSQLHRSAAPAHRMAASLCGPTPPPRSRRVSVRPPVCVTRRRRCCACSPRVPSPPTAAYRASATMGAGAALRLHSGYIAVTLRLHCCYVASAPLGAGAPSETFRV